MTATWDGARLSAAVAALKDTGMTEAAIARMAGASRASANRWARGTHRPDHDPIQRLALRVYARFPGVARELVEASGYAWAEPPELPPADVLADELGQDTAEKVRRELARRGEAGKVVLAEMERVLSSPGEEAASGPGRVAS